MTLAPGTRIGPYEITASVGAGGMGEVYRAFDTSLDRDVAIKVLPEVLATDPERVARFSREAKTLASLNHANIAHIHGVLESPFALVMEFVEGEDLAERLARGAIPLDDAIPIAKQIADALECAHEQGIVHRDLKPANVKVRPDGAVKVLDFGLAKALSAPAESLPSGIAPILSPTFTSPAMTQLGIILGTAAYMAPEQARGKVVDKRADVWAFGVVLFEMLSGTRLFEGTEVSDTLAFVLTRDPDWNALPADTPLPVRRLLRRCLHKDRKQRLADISDARLELDEALLPQAAPPAAVAAAPASWRRVAILGALFLGVLLGGAAARQLLVEPPIPARVMRFVHTLPDGLEFSNTGRNFIDLSRDESKIVYTAGSQMFVRHLERFAAQAVPGTSNAAAVVGPVFSPDGESIAFFTQGSLRTVPVAGGSPLTLVPEIANPHGLFWSTSGIFAGIARIGIVRIPEGGGTPEVVAKIDGTESAQGPQLLADNDTLVFTIYPLVGDARFDQGKIVAQSLKTGQRKILHDGGSDGQILPTGHLLYGLSNVVYARKFDLATLSVSGAPTAVLQGVKRGEASGAMTYRVGARGTLIYVSGPAVSTAGPRTLGLLNREGKVTPLDLPANTFDAPRLSPDGSRLAVGVSTESGGDIWIQDLPVKSALRLLTFGGRNRYPVWSPDGKQIAFQSNRAGDDAVYVQDADVSGSEATLLLKPEKGISLAPTGWAVGGYIAMTAMATNGSIVQVLSLKDHTVRPVTTSAAGLTSNSATFSRDGRWLAYAVSRSGSPFMTFVEPFPSTREKYQIGEGAHPAWSPDGTELLVNPRAPTFSLYSFVGRPRVAFSLVSPLDRGQSLAPNGVGRWYDFWNDKKQLLVVMPASTSSAPSRDIHVVLNWFEELKKVK